MAMQRDKRYRRLTPNDTYCATISINQVTLNCPIHELCFRFRVIRNFFLIFFDWFLQAIRNVTDLPRTQSESSTRRDAALSSEMDTSRMGTTGAQP